jgi:Beta protein
MCSSTTHIMFQSSKGKRGNLLALAKADQPQKFTPLVEVIPIPLEYPEDAPPRPSKTIDKHVKDTAASYVKTMGILPSVFIDGGYIEQEENLHDGTNPVAGLFSRLRSGGIKFIPVIGLDRTSPYAGTVRDAVATDKRGCCLRLTVKDLESLSDLGRQIDSVLGTIGVTPNGVHLLVDFADQVPPKVTLPFLIDALPRVRDWHTLTLACSSFPETLGDVDKNTIDELDRSEWAAWVHLRNTQESSGKRVPTFGDYGVNHPILTDDLDPKMIIVAPNIRYTSAASFVIAKGQAQPRKKKAKTTVQKVNRANLAPKVQYPKLANMIKSHPTWKKADFSWGDKFIDRCSQNHCTGTGSDWRGVGASHHIALVVQQIANLPERGSLHAHA